MDSWLIEVRWGSVGNETPAPVTETGRAWLIVMVGAVDRQDPAEEHGLPGYSNCYDTVGWGISMGFSPPLGH
jgi:hypothetical protein